MSDIVLAPSGDAPPAQKELDEFVERTSDGVSRIHFSVPDAYCAACIDAIERGLRAMPQVVEARVNLTRRTVRVDFRDDTVLPWLSAAIAKAGYRNHPLDPRDVEGADPYFGELIKALGVAAFATIHVMFFSEAIWAGIDDTTRQLFFWISAVVALPATVYAGRTFFRSAWAALAAGRTNMDVPIAVGIIATTAISLHETIVGGEHAYYDASTMLLLFLLAGRVLEHSMRAQARSAVTVMARLAPRGANVMLPDGRTEYAALNRLQPGMTLALRPGDRVPTDATLISEAMDCDMSMVTGESLPVTLQTGASLPAGALNLSSTALVEVSRPADESYLSRTTQLMEAAESTRTRYRRIADRAAALYAPLVHLAAASTFFGWWIAGSGWHVATLNAVSVLIVTCPCALALAVPVVHVLAAERLLKHGVVMRDGAALERLSNVRAFVFDKTGTLTEGMPKLIGSSADAAALDLAGSMAAASNHPLSRAISAAANSPLPFSVTEHPGKGVEHLADGVVWRLGSAAFCGGKDPSGGASAVWLSRDGHPVARFDFEDPLRPEALVAAGSLMQMGQWVEVLSGDGEGAVLRVAHKIGADGFEFGVTPEQKVSRIVDLQRRLGTVAMVGDGINDAAALRAADVSFAPASAADVGRAAADFVLTRDRLDAVPFVLRVALQADRLVRQNLWLSLAYNALMLPLAAAGMVTPLIAAIAMSSSSLIVIANALRLRLLRMNNGGQA